MRRSSNETSQDRMRAHERQLMEETAEAEILEDMLSKSLKLTSEIDSMLALFDHRLMNFESSILPIHQKTQKLNKFYENIENTLKSSQKVIEYFDLADIEQKLVSAGPKENDLQPYLSSLYEISTALYYFNETRYSSSEKALYKLRQQFNSGIVQLAQMYKQWLNSISITLKDNFPDIEIPPVDQQTLKKIKDLSTWMLNLPHSVDAENHPGKIYSQIRCAYLLRCLTPLAPNSDVKRCAPLFIHTISLASSLLREERKIMKYCLPSFKTGTGQDVWANTCSGLITHIIETGSTCMDMISKRTDFSFVFMLFDVLEFWSNQSDKFVSEIFDLPNDVLKRITQMIDSWTHAALRVIPDFLEEVKSSGKNVIPPDATVHETTSNSMSFLKKIVEYPETTESILLTIGETNWTQQNISSLEIKHAKQGDLTEKYFCLVLNTLQSNLEQKAKQYRKQIHGSVFIMNNLNYIHKTLKTNAKIPMSITLKFQEALKSQKDSLVNNIFTPISSNLLDVTVIQDGAIRTSLSSSERNNIKEKFKNFNSQMEDMFKTMRFCTVPDSDLKSSVLSDIKSGVIPLYERFYNKYSTLDFSKNREKYVRYTVPQVKLEIDSAFK